MDEVDEPHGRDEAYGAENTDGRKILYGIVPFAFENGESDCIRQGYGGHVECDTQAISGKNRTDRSCSPGCGEHGGLIPEVSGQ